MRKILLSFAFALVVAGSFAQGCMEPTSSTGGPQVIGYVQFENISEFLGSDASGKDLTKNSFAFRRARIGVTGIIPYNFSYYVMTELSPTLGGPYLLDAFMSYKAAGSYLKVSAGQFKSSFGLELSTPCQSLFTVDRSLVVNELASPFRDQGIMFSGNTDSLKIFGLEKPNVFSWSLAFTNGTGLNKPDNNASKDVIGRIVFAPTNGIQLGGSYHHGKQKNPDPTVTKADELTRWGADLQLKKSFGKFGFISQTEYIYAKDDGSKMIGGGCGATPEVVKGSFKRNGYYSQLMIQTPWKIEPILKFQTYDPNMDLSDYDTKEYRKDTWIFGFNYYMNDWARIQLNYMYNTEASSSTDYTHYNEIGNDMLVLQMQFKLN
ncbi:MAG: porin [Mariniphaga sp.]